MKCDVSVRLQDLCLVGGDAVLLVPGAEDHSTLLFKGQVAQDPCS
jgi:hypothetical protein